MGAGHDHGTGEIQHERPLWWAFGLTAAFLIAEVAGGLITNSLALLSDAAHMATDALALMIALGKIAISITSAFAIVYFRFPLRMLAFWVIFATLMLPVEVRIVPTYKVVADLGLLIRTIAEIDGVSEVYSVTGTIDLIVLVRARRNEEIADIVSDRLNKVPGVLDTETHIAFRTQSKHDLEAAFSIGYED